MEETMRKPFDGECVDGLEGHDQVEPIRLRTFGLEVLADAAPHSSARQLAPGRLAVG